MSDVSNLYLLLRHTSLATPVMTLSGHTIPQLRDSAKALREEDGVGNLIMSQRHLQTQTHEYGARRP